MDSQVEQIDCIKGQVWLRNAREKLGSVVIDRMQGDNLAIVLCGAFEDADEEIDDENGWTRSATDGCDETLDAIHAHYVAIFARRLASLALPKVESETIERQAALSDLEVLVSACEAEFTSEGTEIDPDDDPDGIGGFPDDFSVSDGLADDGQTIVPGQITFGHIRRARAALATLNTGGTHER